MYKITITEVTTTRKEVESWEKLYDSPANGLGNSGQYGNVKINRDVKVEREVLRQEVEDLDVAAVIRAVNNL
jgi:hypothetical protein